MSKPRKSAAPKKPKSPPKPKAEPKEAPPTSNDPPSVPAARWRNRRLPVPDGATLR